MALVESLREHRDTLLRGVVLLVGGLALILAGSMVGYAEGKVPSIAAGVLGVTGVVVMFLGFFIYVLPPILPSK